MAAEILLTRLSNKRRYGFPSLQRVRHQVQAHLKEVKRFPLCEYHSRQCLLTQAKPVRPEEHRYGKFLTPTFPTRVWWLDRPPSLQIPTPGPLVFPNDACFFLPRAQLSDPQVAEIRVWIQSGIPAGHQFLHRCVWISRRLRHLHFHERTTTQTSRSEEAPACPPIQKHVHLEALCHPLVLLQLLLRLRSIQHVPPS